MSPVDLLASVIIPAYGRPEMLREAVRSAVAQDLDPDTYEVIVVDSSPDDVNARTVAELQSEAPCSLRCLTKEPEGPGPSRNLGAREARGRFLAFMDSDCMASPQWLREGIAAFTDEVGLVQGRTIPRPGVPHGIFNFYVHVERESFIYETANILYRREAFEQAGRFPADMNPRSHKPMGGEDALLAWTVKGGGWESRFAPEALVMHEIVPITFWRRLFVKQLYIFPHLVRRIPELRGFLFARYFYDRTQAMLCLGLLGVALATLSAFALLLVLPYLISRLSEPSLTLRGPLRLLRPMIYLPRDLVAMGLLLAGSIRFGRLLL